MGSVRVDGLVSRSGTAQHGTDLAQTEGPRGTVRPGAAEVPTTKISPEERALPRIEDGFYAKMEGWNLQHATVLSMLALTMLGPQYASSVAEKNLSSPEQPGRKAK